MDSWWGWGASLAASVVETAASVAETVQETGSEILNVYKEDLEEFTNIVAQDTKNLLDQNESGITNIVSQGTDIVSFGLSSLTDGINAVSEYAEQQLTYLTEEWEKNERNTFEQEPDDPRFLEWRKNFEWVEKKEEIFVILGNNPSIMAIYQELVPDQISSKDFWERYFFKIQMSNEEKKKEQNLLERTKVLEPQSLDDWGDLDGIKSTEVIPKDQPEVIQPEQLKTDIQKPVVDPIPQSQNPDAQSPEIEWDLTNVQSKTEPKKTPVDLTSELDAFETPKIDVSTLQTPVDDDWANW